MDYNGNPAGHNHLDHGGAVELARRLRKYWLNRGYNITTRAESVQASERALIYGVRSNLVDGLPPEESKVLAIDEAA